MIGIYKITSPSNRIYIGQTTNIENREKYYSKSWCKNQIKLYNSILKYGWENHIFETIEECDFLELNNRERYWQEFYDCVDNGLNCLYVRTDILPKKLSKESALRAGNAMRGKKFTNEQKKNISEGLKKLNGSHIKRVSGKDHWMFGRKFTEEHKQNMRLSRIGKRTGLDSPRSKIILDMQTGIFYYGIKDATTCFNLKYDTLQTWLTNPKLNKTNLRYV